MRFNRAPLSRTEPFFWWGPALTSRVPQSLARLIDQTMLSANEALALAVLYRRGASIFLVSLASGAGKSTLLDAIVQSDAGLRKPIYLRGHYETFDFVESADRRRACLLVNEISPHLPIYLWGAGVREAFEIAGLGFQLCATAHAADAGSLLHALTSPPLNVPLHRAHQPKIVVTLKHTEQGLGRVDAIVTLTPGSTPQATAVDQLTRRRGEGEAPQFETRALVSFLRVAGLDDEGLLEELDHVRQSIIGS